MNKLSNSSKINYFLGQMGIFSYYDVLNHLPKRYDDFTYTKNLNFVDKQRIVVLGKICSAPKIVKTKKIEIVTFDFITSEKKFLRVVAFNRPYLLKNIELENDYTLTGIYNKTKNEVNLFNLTKGIIPSEQSLKPQYNLPSSYPQHSFSMLVRKALVNTSGHLNSFVPFEFQNKYKLINKEKAYSFAHFPKTQNEIAQAYRHLKYEEALKFSLKNQIIRESNKSLGKIKKEPIDLSICKPFLDNLPFKLTDDQINACEEIINDMNQPTLMYRLLQGDVGTGKTLVSFICLYANYLRGDQGALMAPTDSLARQHYENAFKIFDNTKIKIALLLGSTPASEKKRIYDDLSDGLIDIVIGTHALFSKGVNYSSLGLAIIDEQHRFGVNQRLMLSNKGEHCDLLMMSATPIPRSLALSIYADLDVSTLSVFPSKKRDVKTIIVPSDSDKIFKAIDYALENQKKVYIIAPLIDFDEKGRMSVEQLYSKFYLKYHKNVGLLHGKMNNSDKEKALNDFYSGVTNILVSTTVVEVGIDVKTASTIIIYDANNFSLATLHQLRGRIGRDGNKAFCILVSDNEEETERLNVIVKNDDGFVIAEEDMRLRGPGELTGLKQSGIPSFSFLNVVNDFKIMECARNDAAMILKNKDKFQYVISFIKKDLEYHPLTKG